MAKRVTDWFKLSNYDDLENIRQTGWILNLRLWRRQLMIRKCIKDWLMDNDVYRNNAIVDWLPEIKRKPIFDETHEQFLYVRLPSPKISLDYPFNQPTVISTVSGIFFDKRQDVLKEKALPILEKTLSPKELRIIDDVPINYFFQAAGWDFNGAFTFVTIDITATDEQIKEDFGKWLDAYRIATGYKPNTGKLRGEKTAKKHQRFNDKDLKQWLDLKLLPYIDLELAELAGESIDTETKAMLLYPDEYHEAEGNQLKNLRERITGTLKPKADELLSDSVLQAINLQLGH